jgi:hypothetical protein
VVPPKAEHFEFEGAIVTGHFELTPDGRADSLDLYEQADDLANVALG